MSSSANLMLVVIHTYVYTRFVSLESEMPAVCLYMFRKLRILLFVTVKFIRIHITGALLLFGSFCLCWNGMDV